MTLSPQATHWYVPSAIPLDGVITSTTTTPLTFLSLLGQWDSLLICLSVPSLESYLVCSPHSRQSNLLKLKITTWNSSGFPSSRSYRSLLYCGPQRPPWPTSLPHFALHPPLLQTHGPSFCFLNSPSFFFTQDYSMCCLIGLECLLPRSFLAQPLNSFLFKCHLLRKSVLDCSI